MSKTKDSLIKEWHHLLGSRSVPPVPHKLASYGKQREDLNSGGAHAVIGVVRRADVERAYGSFSTISCKSYSNTERTARIGVVPHRVACIAERKSQEGDTNLQ